MSTPPIFHFSLLPFSAGVDSVQVYFSCCAPGPRHSGRRGNAASREMTNYSLLVNFGHRNRVGEA